MGGRWQVTEKNDVRLEGSSHEASAIIFSILCQQFCRLEGVWPAPQFSFSFTIIVEFSSFYDSPDTFIKTAATDNAIVW